MTPLRLGFLLVAIGAIVCMLPGQLLALQLQRAQLTLYVQVNVTPGPYGYEAHRRLAKGGGGDALTPRVVAQAFPSAQAGVPVQANVNPNPAGTSLALSPSFVSISAQAGAGPVTVVCPVVITMVAPAATHWSLESGLTGDFGANFGGNSLAWSLYPGVPPVPQPFTPYTVYPKNNNAWSLAYAGSGNVTLCLDLQLTIPIMAHSGVYGTTAVYSLYY